MTLVFYVTCDIEINHRHEAWFRLAGVYKDCMQLYRSCKDDLLSIPARPSDECKEKGVDFNQQVSSGSIDSKLFKP